MTILDVIKIVFWFSLLIVVFFVLPILAIMRFEGRRAARAANRLAAGLEDARSSEAAGPGAWKLTAIDGRRAGCAISLRPQVLGQTVTVGRTRMKAMGVRLSIRGTRGSAEHDYPLPVSNKVVDEMLATIDAAGPSLS